MFSLGKFVGTEYCTEVCGRISLFFCFKKKRQVVACLKEINLFCCFGFHCYHYLLVIIQLIAKLIRRNSNVTPPFTKFSFEKDV